MNWEKKLEGLLEGIKVVDMGHVVAVLLPGVYCQIGAADVIKIEPLFGDLLRGWTRTAEWTNYCIPKEGEVISNSKLEHGKEINRA